MFHIEQKGVLLLGCKMVKMAVPTKRNKLRKTEINKPKTKQTWTSQENKSCDVWRCGCAEPEIRTVLRTVMARLMNAEPQHGWTHDFVTYAWLINEAQREEILFYLINSIPTVVLWINWVDFSLWQYTGLYIVYRLTLVEFPLGRIQSCQNLEKISRADIKIWTLEVIIII